jgi:hypothetical protein
MLHGAATFYAVPFYLWLSRKSNSAVGAAAIGRLGFGCSTSATKKENRVSSIA